MAWNEPGNDKKDPWGRKTEDGAEQLEESIRKLKQKFAGLLGGAGGSGGMSNDREGSWVGVSMFVAVLLVLWVLSGIFIVSPAEEAVILRFGKFSRVLGSGPHWIPTLIDSRTIVNTGKISSFSYHANMLTKDENIVSVAVDVPYRVDNVRQFLFSVLDPERSLQQATASSLRQVIGNTNLDEAMTKGRENVRAAVQAQLSKLLELYQTGLVVTDVALQPAKAPEEVRAAFDDAINAQEDERRFIQEAQAKAKVYQQQAEGKSQRILIEAKAYKQQQILEAKAKTARYLALLPQYHSAPAVMRERLYFDTMESVLENTTKLLVDVGGSNNMFYLPLDKLMASQDTTAVAAASAMNVNEEVSRNYRADQEEELADVVGRPDRSHLVGR